MTLKSGLRQEQLDALRRLSDRLQEQAADQRAADRESREGQGPADARGEEGAPGEEGEEACDAGAAAPQAAGRGPAADGAPGVSRRLPPVRTAPVHKSAGREIALGRMPALPGIAVTCWSCGQAFKLSAIAGTRGARRCPLCGAELREEHYDREGCALLGSPELAAYQQAKDRLAQVEERRQANRGKRMGLRRLVEAFKVWRAGRKARAGLAAVRDAGLEAERGLYALAQARYYTGRWYLDTRTPLKEERRGPLNAYGLVAGFSREGFALAPQDPGDAFARGLASEFKAYEAARACLEGASRGPLCGAALLADLYLPLGVRGAPARAPGSAGLRWVQVDLVILTTRAILVCEVKTGAHDVYLEHRDGGRLYRRLAGGALIPVDRPLAQVDAARGMLCDILPNVARERIYRAVLYAGGHGVDSDVPGYRQGLCADTVEFHGDRFLRWLEHDIARLEPFTTPSGVADMADALLVYGDPQHTKLREHVGDIQGVLGE